MDKKGKEKDEQESNLRKFDCKRGTNHEHDRAS